MTVVDNRVEQQVRIAAGPETVFEYLVVPELLARWLGTPSHLDARPGGGFVLDVAGRDTAAGSYEVVERPHRVRMRWGWEGNPAVPPGSGTLEITLVADGDDTTLVTLVHSGLPDPQSREQHEEGWRHYLERLSVVAAGGDAGVDPWAATAPASSEA